jgi:hypothetical protein
MGQADIKLRTENIGWKTYWVDQNIDAGLILTFLSVN